MREHPAIQVESLHCMSMEKGLPLKFSYKHLPVDCSVHIQENPIDVYTLQTEFTLK